MASCREETIDDSQVYKQQMAAMSGGAQMMDVNKAFAGERQALEMVRQSAYTAGTLCRDKGCTGDDLPCTERA